jgi:predicted amidohydrolase YtcJ
MNTPVSRRTALAGAAVAAAGLGGKTALAQDATPNPAVSSGPITIFQAKKIVTMDPDSPEVEYVAVRDGRILGAGTLDELSGWGDYTLDDTFKDHVLVPGLVEAHCHIFEGMTAILPWSGRFDRPGVNGETLKGITGYDDLIATLKAEDAKLTDATTPLISSGFDPIYFWDDNVTLDAAFLDQVSTTRQIAVWWANGHDMTVNTAVLQANNITSATKVPGVLKDAKGNPTGQLNETPAMGMAKTIFMSILEDMSSPVAIAALGKFAVNAGCTTITDMASTNLASAAAAKAWDTAVNAADYPARVVLYADPTLPGANATPANVVEVFQKAAAGNTDKLIYQGIKLVCDGSPQSFTAAMNWPGYYKGPNDLQELLIGPEELTNWMTPLHEAGVQCSVHCNGSRTVDVFLDTLSAIERKASWPDARHVCQHATFADRAQFERMAELGAGVNLFSNHIWYWGDQHYEIVMGPERTNEMVGCGTARDLGLNFSFHTDASVTPLGHMHTMWCAVNRVTPQGRTFAEEQKLTAGEALYAATMGAAKLLKMDDRIGSIETGKFADFTVLEESPLDVDPMKIKEIVVWGTVLGGVKQQGAGIASIDNIPAAPAGNATPTA